MFYWLHVVIFEERRMRVALTTIFCMYLFYVSGCTRLSSLEAYTESCGMHFVQLRVRHPSCIPIKLNARACSGACSSFTKVSKTNPFQLEQACNCCQYAGRKRKTFGMKCPHGGNKRGYRLAVMSVMLPKGCRCRPCSSEPNEIVAPEATMFNTSPIIGDFDIFKHK